MHKLRCRFLEIGRFIRFVTHHFIEDDCTYRASALTFTSLLAIVPLMAVGLAIFSAFPVFRDLVTPTQDFIFDHFVPSTGKLVQNYLMNFTNQVQKLSILGMLFLLVTSILMMYTIEQAMNQIWRVEKQRRGALALLLYWAILSLSPILLGLSIAASSYLLSLPMLQSHQSNSYYYQLTPFLFSWLGFTFLYVIVPNCRVRFYEGLVGAFFAAVLFEAAKNAFALYLSNYNSYELLYGAFAAVPIFFIWIYWAWLMTLLGAEVSYALSVHHQRRQGEAIDGFNHALQWLYQLWIAQQEGKSLSEKALVESSSKAYLIDVKQMLKTLSRNHLIEETQDERYILSRDLSHLSLYELYTLLPYPLPPNKPKGHAYLHQWEAIIFIATESIEKHMNVDLEALFNQEREHK